MTNNRIIRVLNIGKWAAFLLGIVMYLGTRVSFGDTIAMVLSILATVVFFTLVRNEETRQIGGLIAKVIESAISRVDMIQSVVEIKRIKQGLIARVYLIGAKEKERLFHKAIATCLDRSEYKKYVWMMQMTSMNSLEDLKESQHAMNEQLIDALVEQDKEKNKAKDKEKDGEKDK